MPIISKIGRKSAKARVLIGSIYVILALGAVTMIYPFLLMISGSTKSGVDSADYFVVPKYLTEDEALYRKDCEAFFNESLDMYKMAFDRDADSFKKVTIPEKPNLMLASEFETFLAETKLSPYSGALSYVGTLTSNKTIPVNLRAFKGELLGKYKGDLHALNSETETFFTSWNAFYMLPESYLLRRESARKDPLDKLFTDFKLRQPASMSYYFNIEGHYRNIFLMSQYTKTIDTYNKDHGTTYKD